MSFNASGGREPARNHDRAATSFKEFAAIGLLTLLPDSRSGGSRGSLRSTSDARLPICEKLTGGLQARQSRVRNA